MHPLSGTSRERKGTAEGTGSTNEGERSQKKRALPCEVQDGKRRRKEIVLCEMREMGTGKWEGWRGPMHAQNSSVRSSPQTVEAGRGALLPPSPRIARRDSWHGGGGRGAGRSDPTPRHASRRDKRTAMAWREDSCRQRKEMKNTTKAKNAREPNRAHKKSPTRRA